MATLEGNTIASTYTGILSVSGAVGADTVEAVTDGAGTSTSLSLSQQRATITLGSDAGDDFIVDGTTLVVEGDNNRVGIGNSVPLSTLHVDGGVNAIAPNSGTTSNAITRLELTGTDIGLDIGATTTGTNRVWLQVREDTTDDLSVTLDAISNITALTLNEQGGYVGINYASPIFPLHIQGAGNIHNHDNIVYKNAIGIAGNSGFLATTAVIQLGDDNGTFSRQWAISNGWFADGSGTGQQHAGNLYITSSGAKDKDPLSATSPGTTAFTFDRVGYFGIGIADPASSLHIKNDSGVRLRLEGDSTYLDLYKVDNSEKLQIESDSGYVHLCCDGSTSKTGIGGSPSYPFHVMTSDEDIASFTSTDDCARILIQDDADTFYVGTSHDNNCGFIGYAGGTGTSTGNLNINRDGHVGIGATPNNVYPLDVRGNTDNFMLFVYNARGQADGYGIKVQAGANDGSGTTYYMRCDDGDGDAVVGYLQNAGGTFSAHDPSDIRLKKDIVDTTVKGLDTVNGMRIRDFTYKKNNIKSVAGFIANELKTVFPSAVSGEEDAMEDILDDNGNKTGERILPMTISRDMLVPVLVKAVQELSAKVTALENA